MKILLIILLLSLNLFAQEVISVSKGSAKYLYEALNVSATVSDGQIIFSGASIRTRNASGTSNAVKRYLHWKLNGEAL